MPKAPPSAPAKPRRRWAMGCGVVVLVLLVLAGVGAYLAYHMSQAEPERWQQTKQMIASRSPDDLERIASNTQNRLFTAIKNPEAVPVDAHPQAVALTDATPAGEPPADPADGLPPPPPGAHRITVGIDEVNVWLHVGGLRKLFEHVSHKNIQWPSAIRGVALDTAHGQPRIMLDYNDGSYRQLITLGLDLHLNPDGSASLALDSVRLGTLPTPASTVLNQVRKHAANRLDPQALAWIDRLVDGVTFDPQWQLDGRRVRVVGLNILEDRIVADLLPVPPSP